MTLPEGWHPDTIKVMDKGSVEDRARAVALALYRGENWCLAETKRGTALCDIKGRVATMIPVEVTQCLIDQGIIEWETKESIQ